MIAQYQIVLACVSLCAFFLALCVLAFMLRPPCLAGKSRSAAAVFLAFAAIATIEAQKTNSPPQSSSLMRYALPDNLNSSNPANLPTWNIRGAWDDSFRLDFEDGWEFPHGTGHLHGVEVISQGALWPQWTDTNAVASVGAKVSIVPGLTTFGVEHTPSNSYRFAWADAAVGRDTNALMTASIELMRNGDRATTTNGVTEYTARPLPFAHDGFGQDAEWVAANFTNAAEILSHGYAAWVDEQVGTGLTNGLYKLTVGVDETPPETVLISVGEFSVAVTNAGEYVFLLEKGARYDFSASADFATNFSYSVADDVPQMRGSGAPPVRGRTEGRWTADLPRIFIPPASTYVLYEPTLLVLPDAWAPSWLSPSKTFTALVIDLPVATPAPTFAWSSIGSANVAISAPAAATTMMTCPFPESYGQDIALRLYAEVAAANIQADFFCGIERYNAGDYTYLPPGDIVDDGWTSALTVDASPGAVFFEKGHGGNMDPVDVACRFRTTEAGEFVLSMTGDSCQVRDADMQTVSNGYSWEAYGPCDGVRHFSAYSPFCSSSPSGTVFSVTFTPFDGTNAMSAATSAVFVEWETETVAEWPDNRDRRTIGVCEDVYIYFNPFIDGLNLCNSVSNAMVVSDNIANRWKYTAPHYAAIDSIDSQRGGRLMDFIVVEPTGYSSNLVALDLHNAPRGTAGEFEMLLELTLQPTNVSFYAISVIETAFVATNATGYFLEHTHTNFLVHSSTQGANNWIPVGSANELSDTAGSMELSPPWGIGGDMTWPIPNGFKKTEGYAIYKYFCNTDQHFSIDSDGTVRVEKFDWYTTVTTNRNVHYGRRNEER